MSTPNHAASQRSPRSDGVGASAAPQSARGRRGAALADQPLTKSAARSAPHRRGSLPSPTNTPWARAGTVKECHLPLALTVSSAQRAGVLRASGETYLTGLIDRRLLFDPSH